MCSRSPAVDGQGGLLHKHLRISWTHVSAEFVYKLFPSSPHTDERIEDFFARRHRAASHQARSSGRWSGLWVNDLQSWHAHVERRHDSCAWSPIILNWRDHQWLSLRRLWNSALGESRTNTRAFRGHVHRRWQEGLEIIKTR